MSKKLYFTILHIYSLLKKHRFCVISAKDFSTQLSSEKTQNKLCEYFLLLDLYTANNEISQGRKMERQHFLKIQSTKCQ